MTVARVMVAGVALAVALLMWPGSDPSASDAEDGSPSQESGLAAPDTAEALIERVLEAYGGVERIRSVQAIRQEGMVIASSGEHGSTVRIASCPSELSLVIEYPGRSEVRIVEGDEAWQGPSPSTLTPTAGPMRAAMELQAARTCLPNVLDLHRSDAMVEESSEVFTVLIVELGEGLLLRVFVANDTHRVLRSESLLPMGGAAMSFASDYGDWREVDGLLVPFQEESFAGGTHTASIRLQEVELNPEGDRALLPIPRG